MNKYLQSRASRLLTVIALVAINITAIACEEDSIMIPSAEIETNQMFADYLVVQDADGLLVQTSFRNKVSKENEDEDDNNGFIDMSEQEKIDIVQGEDFRVTYKEPQINEDTVQGYTLIKIDSEDFKKLDLSEEIVLELIRPEGKESALLSKVVLPEAFEVTLDGGENEVNITENDILLEISGDSDVKRSYTIKGECDSSPDQTYHKEFTGNTLKIEKTAFAFSKETCKASIMIGKSKEGTLDSELKGGKILGVQEVTIDILLKK